MYLTMFGEPRLNASARPHTLGPRRQQLQLNLGQDVLRTVRDLREMHCATAASCGVRTTPLVLR
jgi:hypothetical protein